MMHCVFGNYDVEASLTWGVGWGERWERVRERNTSVQSPRVIEDISEAEDWVRI